MTLRKTFALPLAFAGAIALTACGEQKPPAPAEPPAVSTPPVVAEDPKCPTLAINVEVGKPAAGKVTFTVSPVPTGVTNWTWNTTAGSIVEGQGTTTIVVENQTAGELFTVAVEAIGIDASCDRSKAFKSATAQMP